MNLFGFQIRRQQDLNPPQSFAPPISDDGGVNLITGGFAGSYVDLEGSSKTESDLITRYRDMSLQPEIEMAIDEITNEAISIDPTNNRIIDINLDQINIDDKIKQLITNEFNYCLRLLNFNHKAYEIFRQWYIDGRLYYHAIIDNTNLQNGIVELRYIDPRNLRKVREIKSSKTTSIDSQQTVPTQKITEYFLYSNKGTTTKDFSSQYTLKIAKDSIVYCTSGLTDKSNQMVLSYLHKAIKPLNQLRILEDATVIYRISRAPERRIFYIDIGNLPKMKAEQYVRDMMVKHKNKLAYDASTGEIRDDRKFTTMLEDYWIPRREGGRGTEISTLPGASNIDQVSDLTYFKDALYNSLNIPVNRIQSDSPFVFGETDNITKAEVKFFKTIQRMRTRFQSLFLSFLEKQLILKNIMSFEDWESIKQYVKFDYTVDNFFAELKQGEILKQRVNLASMIEPFIGKYYSEDYVRRNILQQSEEDILEIDSQIKIDRKKALERAIVQANQDAQVSLVQGRASLQLQSEQMQMAQPTEPDTKTENK
jgi:hypothetical protein